MRSLLLAFTLAMAAWSAQPGFEVSSIRPNNSADLNSTWRFAGGGRFTGENVNVGYLIQTAYRLRDFQIAGLPGWTRSAKYDIQAKGEGNPTEEQLMAMLRGLLENRFKLAYHRVTKEGPVYALVAAKGGIKLKELDEGPCAPPDPNQRDPLVCDSFFTRRNQIDAKRITMPTLALALQTQLDRPVIDNTGFNKRFDAHLEWTPAAIADDPDGLDGPSIFTAIQEQLGLKLEARKGPVDTLVIDRIEMPDDN